MTRYRMTKQKAYNGFEDDYFYHLQKKTRKGWKNFGLGALAEEDKLGLQKLLRNNQPLPKPTVVVEWIKKPHPKPAYDDGAAYAKKKSKKTKKPKPR